MFSKNWSSFDRSVVVLDQGFKENGSRRPFGGAYFFYLVNLFVFFYFVSMKKKFVLSPLNFASFIMLCCFAACFCAIGCSNEDPVVGIDSPEKEKSEGPEKQLDSVSLSDYDHLKGYVEYVGRVASVTLYELDSGIVFTGREFTEAVDTSNGFFDFKNLKLQSPYALLKYEAVSYYPPLWGFVDLDKNDSIHLNTMMNLEYRRVMKLVKDGLPTDSAEKQAQHEIMKDLFQKVYDIKPSNQISNDEADSVASAIHRIYSKYLFRDKIAYKYELDGIWKIDSMKTHFADQVYFFIGYPNAKDYDFGMARLCATIFGNVEGIGECSAKNDGEAKRVVNEMSDNYRMPFVCKKDSGWTYPGARFQDTFEWEPGYDGEWRRGDFHNPFKYAYDSLQGEWISYLGDSVGVACVSSKVGIVRKRTPTNAFDSGYDKCILKDEYYYWSATATEEDYIEYGTKDLECDSLGRVQKLSVDPNFYVVCEEGKFRKATDADIRLDLIEREKAANPCGDEDDDLRQGKVDTTIYYSCYHGALKMAGELDKFLGKACNLGSEGYYKYQNSLFYCNGAQWKYSSDSLVTETVTDEHDNSKYKTVGVGTQIWMAENLKLKTDSSWCYQDEDDANCERYGRLYQWKDNVGAENICPEGFHVPSSKDWETLKSYVNDVFDWDHYTRILGAKDGWKKSNEWYIGNDDFVGFSAFASGVRDSSGKYADLFEAAYFCTTDHTDSTFTVYKMQKILPNFEGVEAPQNSVCSIRCIKD